MLFREQIRKWEGYQKCYVISTKYEIGPILRSNISCISFNKRISIDNDALRFVWKGGNLSRRH